MKWYSLRYLRRLMTAKVMHMIPSKLALIRIKIQEKKEFFESSIPKDGIHVLTIRLVQEWMLMSW